MTQHSGDWSTKLKWNMYCETSFSKIIFTKNKTQFSRICTVYFLHFFLKKSSSSSSTTQSCVSYHCTGTKQKTRSTIEMISEIVPASEIQLYWPWLKLRNQVPLQWKLSQEPRKPKVFGLGLNLHPVAYSVTVAAWTSLPPETSTKTCETRAKRVCQVATSSSWLLHLHGYL